MTPTVVRQLLITRLIVLLGLPAAGHQQITRLADITGGGWTVYA